MVERLTDEAAKDAAAGTTSSVVHLAAHRWLIAAALVLALAWMKACAPAGDPRPPTAKSVEQVIRYALWRARLVHEH